MPCYFLKLGTRNREVEGVGGGMVWIPRGNEGGVYGRTSERGGF